jgi:glycosyltransferase involved in cell wall biosynthesis
MVLARQTHSVVIPVYNSEQSLEALIQQLSATVPAFSMDYEIILVNDGSRDGSWEKICQLIGQYPQIHAINLMRNYGQHNALLCGIRAARHEIIITMDDDLQHPPGEIPKLLAKLSEGYDVVYGKPEHEQHGLWRDLASQITKFALKSAMGAETARHVSAFRALRTPLREAFANFRGPYVSIDVLLTWATTRFAAVTVAHHPRHAGVSNYTFYKLVVHAVNMMTGFSAWPLQVAGMLGFVFACLGLLVLAYVLIAYLVNGGSVPGFPFLASTILVFSGVQLFALGVIGEYLARMHFRLLDKPAYTVREHIVAQEEKSPQS